jgi:tripartite-type tricarboxylate transporter receptor subunit TctC
VIVERVSTDVQTALREAKLQADIIARGGIPDPRTPRAYASFVRSEIDKWARVAREAKIRLDE